MPVLRNAHSARSIRSCGESGSAATGSGRTVASRTAARLTKMTATAVLTLLTIVVVLAARQEGAAVLAFTTNPRSANPSAARQFGALGKRGSPSVEGSWLRPSPSSSKTTSTRLNVFERMSEWCVSGIVASQVSARELGCDYTDTAHMVLGCIDVADKESPALVRTLNKYNIRYRAVTKALKQMYDDDDEDSGVVDDDPKTDDSKKKAGSKKSAEEGLSLGFTDFLNARQGAKKRTKNKAKDPPFSKELQRAFVRAASIANGMGSTEIKVQHVFLSLLDRYDEPASEQKRNIAWELITRLENWKYDVTALEICESLIERMKEDEKGGGGLGGGDPRELVTGHDSTGGGKTTLLEVGVDLTKQAKDGLLDPVHGRDAEIRSCLRTLLRRRKNCVCLLGDPGVGKTAIAEGVAQALASGTCPKQLRGHRLVSLQLSALVAGTKYRGEFEDRLQSIVREITDPKAEPTILFIDELHNLVGAGAAEGGMDAANLLKPALARGELQMIGATTVSEYRKYVEKDAALERRLQPVWVQETSVDQTIAILKALQPKYEQHHGVTYTLEALKAAAVMAERYINDRFLPDKAIDLLDESGALAQMDVEDFGEAKEGDSAVSSLANSASPASVTEHTVAAVVSEMTGIPMGQLETAERDKLQALEESMEGRVVGQNRAVRGVARAIRRARSGLRDPKRPVASFLFCGPTGTGKTELCKTLAETYYGSEKDMIRVDMSEYMEKHSLSRLIGSPPGYIGFDDGGQLTEAVRRSPHSVVLLDEVEKAHEDVLNILLQIMEDGVLTDGKGRRVNFKDTILVMTSNVGSKRIQQMARAESSARSAKPLESSRAAAISSKMPKSISPEEALKKFRNSPKASQLLLRATANPDLMQALRTAMDGTPADLVQASQANPHVANFLEELWGVMTEDDDVDVSLNGSAQPSGLDAIKNGVSAGLNGFNGSTQPTPESVPESDLYPRLAQVVKDELEDKMKPELLNRIDEIVVFSPLSNVDLKSIASLIVDKVLARARKEHGMDLKLGDRLLEQIVKEGSAKADQFGARPMRRAAQRYVEDSLSDALIQGFLEKGDGAVLDVSGTATSSDGKNVVVVTRQRDGRSVNVEVDSVSAGIDGSETFVSHGPPATGSNVLPTSAAASF